jgi:hypothetical protein
LAVKKAEAGVVASLRNDLSEYKLGRKAGLP